MKALVIACLAISMLGLTALPASAAAPVITPDGGSYAPGTVDQVSVDLTHSPTGEYWLDIEKRNGYFYRSYGPYHYDGSNPDWVRDITALYSPGTYDIWVEGETDSGGSVAQEAAFSVKQYRATITAPTQGLTKSVGADVTAKVRWDMVAPDTKVIIQFYSHRTYSTTHSCTYYVDAAQSSSCTDRDLTRGWYTVRAKMVHQGTGDKVLLDDLDFYIVRPFEITSASTNIDVFYPLVNDGWRDWVTMRWNATRDAQTVIRVHNSEGKVIKRVERNGKEGSNNWEWYGKNNSGEDVREGTYTIRVTGSDGNRTDSVARKVTVNSRWKVEHWHSWKGGALTNNIDVDPLCWASKDDYDYSLYMTCYDTENSTNDTVTARYNLPIHKNAYDFDWNIRYEQDCCWSGELKKSGYRLDSDTYRVVMSIGGDRSLDLYRVRVEYKRKVRV